MFHTRVGVEPQRHLNMPCYDPNHCMHIYLTVRGRDCGYFQIFMREFLYDLLWGQINFRVTTQTFYRWSRLETTPTYQIKIKDTRITKNDKLTIYQQEDNGPQGWIFAAAYDIDTLSLTELPAWVPAIR